MAAHDARRARGRACAPERADHAPRGGVRERHRVRDGLADHVRALGAGRVAHDGPRVLRRPRAHVRLRRAARRRARKVVDPARAGRCGGRDHPLERAAVRRPDEARARARGGVHGGAEAAARDAAVRVRAGGGHRGSGGAEGGREHRGRGSRGRRAPGAASGSGQGELHREHARGAEDRGDLAASSCDR